VTTIAVAGTQLKPAVWRWVLTWSVGDIKRVLPTIIFFFLGFALVLWAQRIILQEQQIEFSDFLVATMAALIVGTVLVRDHIPFMRRFEGAALIPPILVKTTIYSVCVFLVKLGKRSFDFLHEGGTLVDFPTYLIGGFSWPRFTSIQVWLMVLFLVYVAIYEPNRLIGDGELYRLFFGWRSSQAKLTRRQHIRLLTRLSRLTKTNFIETFRDPRSAPHAALVRMIRGLAASPDVRALSREDEAAVEGKAAIGHSRPAGFSPHQ